uniref:Tripartite motif-containing protein 16-like n=1 Tax=Astatotilapia calliptera TaxID=8154 RepID=A0AAX7V6X7_ASTCA
MLAGKRGFGTKSSLFNCGAVVHSRSFQLASLQFCCAVCLDLLKDPVTIPCGHNYCMSCIETYWKAENAKGIHSCPQCRQAFTPRPILVKNTMLAELVEKMKYLQPIHDSPAFEKHKLVDKVLKANTCSVHNEVMKMFCRTDQMCVCCLCWINKHRGHETVPVEKERADKEKDLEEGGVLEKEIEGIKLSADTAVKDIEMTVDELVSFIKENASNLKQQIRSQQKDETSRVEELQKKLEQEIAELRRKEEELKQLSRTEDHTEFLLSYSTMPVFIDSTDSSSFKICQVNDPKTRDDFLKHSFTDMLQDPDNSCLKNRDRFSIEQQVLSKESLTGPCYWEVEWKGKGLSVAVTYKNENKLDQTAFGSNNNSWALDCYKDSYKFRHNNTTTRLLGPSSSKIGVYLNPRAGILCFYSVSDTMALLHRVQTTFTEPLYAGLWIWGGYFISTTATLNDIQ